MFSDILNKIDIDASRILKCLSCASAKAFLSSVLLNKIFLCFGGRSTEVPPWRSGLQTTVSHKAQLVAFCHPVGFMGVEGLGPIFSSCGRHGNILQTLLSTTWTQLCAKKNFTGRSLLNTKHTQTTCSPSCHFLYPFPPIPVFVTRCWPHLFIGCSPIMGLRGASCGSGKAPAQTFLMFPHPLE